MYLPFFRTASAAMLLALLTPALSAQPYTINTCTDSLRIWPPIVAEQIGGSLSNQYRFHVDWSRVAGISCHRNPPSPIVEGQDSLARWIYFWDFGDGTFSRDSAPEHAFLPGTYDVKVALKPTYSDDDDPIGFATQTTVVAGDFIPPSYPSLLNGTNVALQANWSASRPGGFVVAALTYPKITATGQPGRTVYLAFPENEFSLDTLQSAPIPNLESEQLEWNGKQHRVYSWRFTDPDTRPTPNPENTLFVHLKVKEEVADFFPADTSSILTHILALIKIDRQASPNEGKEKGGGGVPNPSPWSGVEMVSRPVSLNWASDPNYIEVSPRYLPPGVKEQLLTYTIGFYNGGSATADTLRVNAHIQRAHIHPTMLSVLLSRPAFAAPTTAAVGADHVIRWAHDDANLPSLGQAQHLGFDSSNCFGEVKFQIQTRPGYVFQEGDSIGAVAHLRMERSFVSTNTEVLRVRSRCLSPKPSWGIKVQYHLPHAFRQWQHESGYHLALTLRRPLGKICGLGDGDIFARYLPKDAFPLFWWQGEIGYGQTRVTYDEARAFNVGHADLTPLSLRYIARMPRLSPGLPRSIGLSAGYTASFLLHGEESGSKLQWNNLSDRIDHSLSVSLDLLNLIGRPGLAVGTGWRWRNTALGGSRQWYENAFTYVHYTF